jgi:AraC-like DNA-binding protein
MFRARNVNSMSAVTAEGLAENGGSTVNDPAATAVRGRPSPTLRNLVLGYTGFQFTAVRPRARWELPCGTVTLVIGFGQPLSLRPAPAAGDRQPSAIRLTSLVSGVRTTATIGEHAGSLYGVEVVLDPLGAYRILRLPMRLLAESFVPLDAVLGADSARLADRLHSLPDWPSRFAHLDSFFIRRLTDGPATSKHVPPALSRLVRAPFLPIAALADELGCSERHLRSRFREEVGLPPKALARVHRLQSVLRSSIGGLSWADSAARWGFQDQSHLANEFKSMTGLTATEFTRLRQGRQPGSGVDRLPDSPTSILLGTRHTTT